MDVDAISNWLVTPLFFPNVVTWTFPTDVTPLSDRSGLFFVYAFALFEVGSSSRAAAAISAP